jgi:hypothetical protein
MFACLNFLKPSIFSRNKIHARFTCFGLVTKKFKNPRHLIPRIDSINIDARKQNEIVTHSERRCMTQFKRTGDTSCSVLHQLTEFQSDDVFYQNQQREKQRSRHKVLPLCIITDISTKIILHIVPYSQWIQQIL